MSNSYINFITFLLTTLFYYIALKPSLTIDIISDNNKYGTYFTNYYLYLGIYLLLVVIIQFIVNASVISSNCGGKLSDNMGSAGLITFIPWILIFGVIIIILVAYPGFKSAFSDVIGYFYVSNSANTVMTELLINKDLQNNLSKTDISDTKRIELEEAADAIVKICGNTSILINQIVPNNFIEYWNVLKPLMKPKYQADNPETNELQKQLFDLVVTKDNIGESMWYIYTGFLIISLVQLKISTNGCKSNPLTMQQNYNTYLDEQKQQQKKQELNQNTTYTIG